ncbi:hypothetical protein [Devosia sediminis]|uniref:Uncharacterized protein n=1 Tax=Devosia sediminis TaxID=2798801 RepID=A0A934J257_9HYPH|nr:hypothetical protein [Devosia sediminis]MBJ3786365.1 hypothetical protein [Devosia sediminis]
MNAEYIAAFSGIAAAAFAGVGLIFAGLQTRQASRSRDFDTLSGILEHMRVLERNLADAVVSGDEKKTNSATVELLNWIELLAAGTRMRLLGQASREFSRDLIVDVMAMLEVYGLASHLDGRLTGEAYKHSLAFLKTNRSAIEARRSVMRRQDADLPERLTENVSSSEGGNRQVRTN